MSLLEVEIADATIVEHAYAIWAIVLFFVFLRALGTFIALFVFQDYEYVYLGDIEFESEEEREEAIAYMEKVKRRPFWIKLLTMAVTIMGLNFLVIMLYYFVMIRGGFPVLEIFVIGLMLTASFIQDAASAIPALFQRTWARWRETRHL